MTEGFPGIYVIIAVQKKSGKIIEPLNYRIHTASEIVIKLMFI